MTQSIYNYEIVGEMLLIVDNCAACDEDSNISITNNMEEVLTEIAKKENRDLTKLEIVYRDSLLTWDRVIVTKQSGNKVLSVKFDTSSELDEDYLENLFFRV